MDEYSYPANLGLLDSSIPGLLDCWTLEFWDIEFLDSWNPVYQILGIVDFRIIGLSDSCILVFLGIRIYGLFNRSIARYQSYWVPILLYFWNQLCSIFLILLSLDLWIPKLLDSQIVGSSLFELLDRIHGFMESLIRIFMDPRIHWFLDSWIQGFIDPVRFGFLDSWIQKIFKS